jgi:hypothetical protein
MKANQRKAVFANLRKNPSPGDRGFYPVFSKLQTLAKSGDVLAQKTLQRINESEGWTNEDKREQKHFREYLRNDY